MPHPVYAQLNAKYKLKQSFEKKIYIYTINERIIQKIGKNTLIFANKRFKKLFKTFFDSV